MAMGREKKKRGKARFGCEILELDFWEGIGEKLG